MSDERPLIGVDVDGCIADMIALALPVINVACGTDFTPEDWVAWFTKDWVPAPHTELAEQTCRDLFSTDGWTRQIVPYPTAVADCLRLDAAYDLFAMTAVSQREMEHRSEWLMSHGFPLVGAAAVPGELKAAFAKNMGMAAVIEDSLDNAIGIAEQGVQVYLIDRPYNRSGDVPLVQRVGSLAHIADLLGLP